MRKKISEILSESTIEETERLIGNIDFDLDNKTKKRIVDNVIKKMHYKKTKPLLINKKALISISATFALLFFSTFIIFGILLNNNGNENVLNLVPSATVSTLPTTNGQTSTPTTEPTTTGNIKPTSKPTHTPIPPKPTATPIKPKEGVEVTWPDSSWVPATAKTYWATYPLGVYNRESETKSALYKANPVEDVFKRSILEFSYNSAYDLLNKNTGNNINYSPLNVYYALALAASGAEGETYSEIMNALGLNDKTKEYLSTQAGNLYRRMYVKYGGNKLKTANSLWLSNDKDISFKESFIENANDNFYSSLFNVNYADKDTATLMRKWIFENTEGTMSPEIDIDTETMLQIISTIYFTSPWAEFFEPEKNTTELFYCNNQISKESEFMHRRHEEGLFFKGSDYVSTTLPLLEGDMVFVLPNEGVSINEFLTSPEKLEAALSSPSYEIPEGYDAYAINISLPKFGFRNNLNLKETLKNLGLNKAFNIAEADFGGITDSNTFISTINQDLFISVDEIGVSAGGAVNLGFGTGDPKWLNVDVNLNRPFIYAIMYAGMPIFIGVCMDPTIRN